MNSWEMESFNTNVNVNNPTMISDNKSSLLKQHANNNRLNAIGKQNSVRKMSTMPEEDGSDADPDSMIVSQPLMQHQHQQDPDSDSPSEGKERARLLSVGSRKIILAPASTSSIASTTNGIKRSSSGNSSTDSVHDTKPRIPQSRLAALESEPRLYRDGLTHGNGGRITRGIELHGSRHRYPSMRSLKSTAADDHHNHHHPASSWASIIFSDAASQSGRPFPDSVSIRSLASIGMGSSDGRKLTIRRVPTSPSELLNMVHPPT